MRENISVELSHQAWGDWLQQPQERNAPHGKKTGRSMMTGNYWGGGGEHILQSMLEERKILLLFWSLKTLMYKVEMSDFRQRLKDSCASGKKGAAKEAPSPDSRGARPAWDTQERISQGHMGGSVR